MHKHHAVEGIPVIQMPSAPPAFRGDAMSPPRHSPPLTPPLLNFIPNDRRFLTRLGDVPRRTIGFPSGTSFAPHLCAAGSTETAMYMPEHKLSYRQLERLIVDDRTERALFVRDLVRAAMLAIGRRVAAASSEIAKALRPSAALRRRFQPFA